MLSNKLTFSLASLIMILALVLASTSVMAAKPVLTIKEVDGTTRTLLTVSVSSTDSHTYDEWNALAPAFRLLDKLGREIGADGAGTGDGTAFTTLTPTDPFGANPGFIAGSTLRLSTVRFSTDIVATQADVSTIGSARSVKVMVAAGAVRSGADLNDMAMATFLLPPVLDPAVDGVPAITGGKSVSSPYMVTITFTGGTAAPAPLPSPMFDFMYDPYPARISSLNTVSTDTTDNVYVYSFMVEPAAGSTALTVTIDETYAQDAMSMDIDALKATDAPPDAVLGAKKFHVYTGAGTNGIVIDAAKSFSKSVADNDALPDLEDLLRLGGTIEIALMVGPKGSTTHTVVSDGADEASITAAEAAKAAYRLVITEVMWGLDGTSYMAQWIEIYNNGAALKAMDSVKLTFHENVRRDNIGKAVTYGTDTTTYVVVDRVSTINRFGTIWAPKGQSGNTQVSGAGTTAVQPTDLISMYRKVNLDAGAYKAKADAKIGDDVTGLDGLGDGGEAGSWEASVSRTNIAGRYVGSPGTVHVTHGGSGGTTVGFGKNPESFAATGVIINEVRNDPSDANLDWIELVYFDDSATALPKNIENWTLSIVEVTMDDDGNITAWSDTDLFSLPKYKLQPGEYLVIHNRHPGETDVAGGVNIDDVLDSKQVNKGSSHLYAVREGWSLPSTGKFLLLLRNGNDKVGTHEKLVDYAGNGFFKRVEANKFNTDVWPFIGWTVPGDQDAADFGGDDSFASHNMSFGRGVELNDKGMWRPKSRVDNRTHKDDWQSFGFVGSGYDRDADPERSPGTPGYENRAVTVVYDDREGESGKSAYAFGGSVTISEVMYDAGPRWNLIQWIELYNSSATETVNLSGWTLEIRNKEDVESYVDSSFKFIDHTKLLPNQTLLLVSGTGANDVDPNRVYNLYQHHRRELGLTARDSRLLSRTGFYLRLTAKIMENGRELDVDDDLTAAQMAKILMDEGGNVEVKGAEREVMWALPERDPDARRSLVRVYGDRSDDGNGPDAASDGAMESSWKSSILSGAGLSYYGHRNDIGTPAWRLGGPLPVSLSSFRPVRNHTTGHVDIRWVTESELNNAGFNILRSERKNGDFKVINVKGIIPGHGTTSEKHVYQFTDTTAKPNVVYYYQIEDVSLNGRRTKLSMTHLRGNISASGKATTTWGDLKLRK